MDPVFMLKCIVAQRLFGKADKDFEQEMLQNIVLQDWLGINYPSDVPSHKTIWKYKEIFAQTEVLETVFSDYVNKLQAINSKVGTEAVIADSSFVEAPKQRNTRQENAPSRKAKGTRFGTIIRTRSATRISTPAGPKNVRKCIMATRDTFWCAP